MPLLFMKICVLSSLQNISKVNICCSKFPLENVKCIQNFNHYIGYKIYFYQVNIHFNKESRWLYEPISSENNPQERKLFDSKKLKNFSTFSS